MKRSIRGHDVVATGLKNIADCAREFGFEYIQLALDLSKEGFALGKFSEEYANEIKDDKLRNDILKMLSDNLRYKDGENDENNEIQRFYTPLLCKDCKLYQDQLSKL